MFHFLSKENKLEAEVLYKITDGRIIFGGSVGLRLFDIIQRKTDDMDFNILYSDWKLYQNIIYKTYKLYPMKTVYNKDLGGDILCYLIKTKDNKLTFNLFVNQIDSMYSMVDYDGLNIRIFKPELIMKAKEQILEYEPHLVKHIEDIEKIKKFLHEKK